MFVGCGFTVGPLNPLVKLLAVDQDTLRRIETKPDLGSFHGNHNDLSVIIENDRLPFFACNDQHATAFRTEEGANQSQKRKSD